MDHVEEKRHEAHWQDIEKNVVQYLLGTCEVGGGHFAMAGISNTKLPLMDCFLNNTFYLYFKNSGQAPIIGLRIHERIYIKV